MASQPGTFNLQEFADAGAPLVSGRLYTYAFGTTTQKVVYTDAAGLVPHTYTLDESDVPYIALNARGELPAPLYLSPGSYDLALKRSDGSSVWTRRADGSDLASSAGASLIGFLQAGTGAGSRTLQDKGREVVSITDFYANGVSGAMVDPTGVTDSTAGIQAAATYAASVGKALYIPGTSASYLVSATVTFPAGSRVCGDGHAKSVIRSIITDGSPCLQFVGGSSSNRLENFSVASSIVSANFLTGAINAQNCTGIALGTASVVCNRWHISSVRVYGCATGWYIRGFIGTADNAWAEYCETGLVGDTLNSVDLNLRLENNRKNFAITGSNAVLFRQMITEGGNSAVLSSTLDNCHGVTLQNPYFEWATYNRATPYVTVGATTECTNFNLRGGNIAGPMAYGVHPVKLDRVDGADVEAYVSIGDRNVSVETTANTKNYRLNVTQATKNLGVHDASKQLGPCFNYFPNRNFDLWFRGWQSVVPTRSTVSQETTLVRKGANAVKILCTAAQVNNYCLWQLSGPSATYLRGKTVRAYAWVWVPDIPDYDESVVSTSRMLPALYIGDNDGVNGQISAARNTGYKKGAWQLMESADLSVQTDATRLEVYMYANNNAAVSATGDEYVVVDSIYIVESSTPFSRVLNDDLLDSPYIDAIGVAGRMVFYADAIPSDADQTFSVGDIVWKLTPAAAASPGWVCTTGGVGGVAVFKAMAAVAA